MSFIETRVMLQQQTQNYMPENVQFRPHLSLYEKREREEEKVGRGK
jgi:hypothetical protein